MPIVTDFDLLHYRRTKIVGTLGPSSSSASTIRNLVEAGVDVFRVNMSHGEHAQHAEAIAAIRTNAAELGRHTAILADLCGPKIRMGRFRDGRATLEPGAKVTITTVDVLGDAELIPSQYEALPADVKPNDVVLLNDGAVELKVVAKCGVEVECVVVLGGVIGDHKGINLPGVTVSAPSLTAKDRDDARFALEHGVDFIALSFVRQAEDIIALRSLVHATDSRAAIIAKIEKPEALRNDRAIIDAADGVMVARGDLGVELRPEQVPVAQCQLIDRARAHNKPVIVATQMLESMISNARPTRAEVTDVSHAVASGADAVMLSGETAVGEFPVGTVEMMARIARQTESYQALHTPGHIVVGASPGAALPFGDAIAKSVAQLVGDTHARAVVVITTRGVTAATISAARPQAPVLAITSDPATCRQMNLMWGVIPVLEAAAGSDNPNIVARRVAHQLGLAKTGEFLVLVRGFHADPDFNTPTVTLLSA